MILGVIGKHVAQVRVINVVESDPRRKCFLK